MSVSPCEEGNHCLPFLPQMVDSLEAELTSSLNTHATLCGVPLHTVEMTLEAAVTASLRFASTERPLFIALTLHRPARTQRRAGATQEDLDAELKVR